MKFTLRVHRGKRGFTYLIVTTFLVFVLLAIFFATSQYKYQDQEALQQVRIRAMNDFVKNLDTDIHRATYISAFRTMLALEDSVTRTGTYFPNASLAFRETFFYGTINGTHSTIMENSTFSDYLFKVQDLAHDTSISLDMNVTRIRIEQHDPWSITVYVLMDISATDMKKTASWNISKEYSTTIPIENMRDPLYSKNTFNRAPNVIRRSNVTLFVNGLNITNLRNHIDGSIYVQSSLAPSFVMRFEGINSPDVNGIESIVNVRALSDQDLPVDEDKVKIDYIYFSNISTDKICNIQGVPLEYHLVLPSNRLMMYNITGLNYSMACP